MEIIHDFKNKKEWNNIAANNIMPASFLQSWEWGEFNKEALNTEIKRLALIDDGELKMIGTVYKKKLPFNKFFWYCPRGLVWHLSYMDRRASGYGEIIKRVPDTLKGALFLRVSPPYQFKKHLDGFLQRLKFRKPEILTHLKEPGKTWVLDLDKSEEKLLINMHSKTRYNIRLAEKKSIKIRISTTETLDQDIDTFYQLSTTTADRDNIHIYSKDYYRKLIKYFYNKNQDITCKLYLAEYQNKPLSAIIMIYFGATATYLHGASSNEYRNLMPNYLIQWQAIKDAKSNGKIIYDFWGISETKPAWAGITRFKKGFGGRVVRFLGSWDYVLDKKLYKLFKFLKLIKKFLHV